ncbi:dermonecrotic toxin domain-containing protein [Pseudomonas tolaasii]|uniref:dermonecrotic toxin domain-containing protein n=1 Tax=Pseudomonas tolaasii TaxID=29442 RepID=UPI0002FD8B57|nr:DUF6543 domain-containing protein [Pseudomonas tolaasii]
MPTLINGAPLGTHYDFIKAKIPDWFTQANARRREELGSHTLQLPHWFGEATPATRATLGLGHARYRDSLNAVDQSLGRIEDIAAFAEPLLKAAIRQQFNLDLDVRSVYFARKYAPQDRSGVSAFLDIDATRDASLQARYLGTSLLETALANFEPSEERALPCTDCQIITTWGSYTDEAIPSFSVLQDHAIAIPAHEFARLCRQLDLGAQYQAHIQAQLQPDDRVRRTALEQSLEQHHREQLTLSLQIAAMQQTVSASARRMLEQLLVDPATATLDGRPVTLSALVVFDSVLVGPLLIGAARKGSGRTERLVVYLPDDPLHPLKEYASSGAFMADLRARLHSASYREYFSRFIPLREQGTFFHRFKTLYRLDGLNGDYPLQAHPPRLPMGEQAIGATPWIQLRQARTRKIFADARAVAVPTGDEDRVARLARLLGFYDAVVDVFNLAAFVVPGVGPLMLLVGAAQLCGEVFDGIEAFEHGEVQEMWAHLASIASNVAAAGTAAKVLPQVRLSSLVDGLQPVTLADGKQKLWRGDLEAYRVPIALPVDALPDALGLYTDNGHTLLGIEDGMYRVVRDPAKGEYRIRHPSREGAYEPRLSHNGQGAWSHELEQPQTWQGARLMRRLGPVVRGFSDAELEQIRHVSGVDEDALRRLHAEHTPVPAILLDTVRQFRAYASAVQVAAGIGTGGLPDVLCGYAASVAVELPGWPAGYAIEAFAGADLGGPSVKYGDVDALAGRTLKIHRAELMGGKLPERITDFFDEQQMDRLVGRYTARDRTARIDAMKSRLQDQASRMRARLMRSLYADQQPATDAAEALVQRDFKHLPTLMVREMLDRLPPAQRMALDHATRLPLDVAQRARQLQQQARLAHAYEGLYLDALVNQDTEALVLNTLHRLPGWSDSLRLEVREGDLQGALRASYGNLDAAERKVLVRVGDGRYEARDERDQHLHGVDDLYASLQHALPDRHRRALGLPHVGQGAQLKQKIIANALSRESLQVVLEMRSPVRSFFRSPVITAGQVGYPLTGRGQGTSTVTVSARVRRLFPAMTDAALSDFLQGRDLEDTSWLLALEMDYKRLSDVLTEWKWANTEGASLSARRRIAKAIRNAWRNSSSVWDVDLRGVYRGQCIELAGQALGPELATLPPLPGNFNHVTGVVLTGCGLTEASTGFLSTFRNLRALDLSDNSLTRLPPVIEQMPFLEHLLLNDNQIVLTAESVAVLRSKLGMNVLSLEGNPLGQVPDVSRMAHLKFLFLAGCELTRWPVGLFARPRPRGFILDLISNPLSEIPEVAPGSDRAQILARTAVSRDQVTPAVLDSLKLYIESVGLDPNRTLPPRGAQDSAHWMAGLNPQQWVAKQPLWDAVEEAEGAEPFFDELRKLSESSDNDDPQNQVLLTAKVWQMIEAMAADTDLRKQLFQMALAPTTCVDAGAQLFNAMGVEVLVRQALAIVDEPLRTRTLLNLAIGKSRLDELGRIANARVAELVSQGMHFPVYDEEGFVVTQYDEDGNALNSIDEVEINLAYYTELATALALPWQSRTMKFAEPNVAAAELENAYKRIEALERGDLLAGRISEQSFWADYLQKAHAVDFRVVENKIAALTDLLVAQQEWVSDGHLTVEQKQALRDTIRSTGLLLGKSVEDLREGQVMTGAQYDVEMADLSLARTQLLTALTGQVLRRFPPNPLAPWAPGVLG